MKHRHMTLTVIFLVLAALLVAAWFLLPLNQYLDNSSNNQVLQPNNFAVWEHDGRCFFLPVADTMPLRRQGLSETPSLGPDEGMLFLYDLSGEYGFWMKGMEYSLDMIWLDRDNEVVTIHESVTPETYPQIFYPTESAKKIIEVTAGTADQLGLKEGDVLNVSAPTSSPTVDCAIL